MPIKKILAYFQAQTTLFGLRKIGTKKQGWGSVKKILVVVVTERIGKQIGRVRFKIIPNASKENLLPFIEENVEYGSTVITDGWSSYSSLSHLFV